MLKTISPLDNRTFAFCTQSQELYFSEFAFCKYRKWFLA